MEQLDGGKVPLSNGTRVESLDVVDEYKHVGATKNALASLGPEIKIRADGIWGKTKRLRKRLFKANDIRRDIKCSALRVMFLSSQLFQAGVWPELLIG